MTVVTARFRIVTPMFLGGAGQRAEGIRPPSVKGALRFWWRALNWGRFRQKPGADDITALKALHGEEARLFGIAADERGGGGQGCFLLRVIPDALKHTNKPTVHPKFKDKDHAAARYLGYGLMVAFGKSDGTTRDGQLERGCLDENQEFTVKLLFRNGIEPSVQEALIAWGLLGGLGSRSRHGMGSIALISLTDGGGRNIWTAPENVDEYDSKTKTLFASAYLPATEPPFSAFWRDSRIDRLLFGNNCYGVLNEFGHKMLMYRSWGRSEALVHK